MRKQLPLSSLGTNRLRVVILSALRATYRTSAAELRTARPKGKGQPAPGQRPGKTFLTDRTDDGELHRAEVLRRADDDLNDGLDNFVVKIGENYEDIMTYDAIVNNKINNGGVNP